MALAAISVLGVDLGKNVCSVVGLDGSGAVVMRRKMRRETLGRWAKGLLGRAHRNVAVVAFANKLARIAWAVLRRQYRFAAQPTMAA